GPNYRYSFFKDFTVSFKRWFYKGNQTELKGLELEHVLRGITKQPISLYEFKSYLQNKEHTGENLEFYYWYKDYKERFESLPDNKKAKSPPPSQCYTPEFDKERKEMREKNGYQPFREEVEATLKTFFNKTDSFKTLYLDPAVLKYTLYYAAETTHPDVFEAAYEQTYRFMKNTSFKNFIHTGVQNVRYGVVVAYLTMAFLHLALVPMILFNTYTLHMSRWSRMVVFSLMFGFVSMLLCGRTGFCGLRCLMKKRQIPDHLLKNHPGRKDKKSKSSNQVDIKKPSDIESNQKPDATNITRVLDKEVIKYGRVTTAVTALVVGITTEKS
ncbi:hypothetical protein A0J61_00090, partial [Choanephora cucurbitarum]